MTGRVRATCPDGGRCHHSCGVGNRCWRVDACGPLSGVFPGDRWPENADPTCRVLAQPLGEPRRHGEDTVDLTLTEEDE